MRGRLLIITAALVLAGVCFGCLIIGHRLGFALSGIASSLLWIADDARDCVRTRVSPTSGRVITGSRGRREPRRLP